MQENRFADFDCLSGITEPHLFASVHGIITSLSPMKTSKKSTDKYFDGRFADEDRSMRFIGFHAEHHQQLQQYYNTFTPISLATVKIQKSSYSDDLEICLQSATNIDKSDRNFEADMIAMEEPGDAKTISIRDMASTVAYQLVNVRCKVCKIFPPQKVATGQQKQDIIVSDVTRTTRLTVWEDVIGTLQLNTFYKLTNVKVRVYKGKNTYPIQRIMLATLKFRPSEASTTTPPTAIQTTTTTTAPTSKMLKSSLSKV